MSLKDALIAAKLAGGSGGSGGGGGVVTMSVMLDTIDVDEWSGELVSNDGRPLNYSDVLALTNNGADDALVQCGGATSIMYYDSYDEAFYANFYAYNPNVCIWEFVPMELSSDGYSFSPGISYAEDVAVKVTIYKHNGQYYSNLSYDAIAKILNGGGYVYVISRPNGVEDCVYTLDKYAYLTGSNGYITFKRISYDTYNNVSRMWVDYFTMNSNSITKESSSYILQPNT